MNQKRPTDYDAFVPLYEQCKKSIHKASREDAYDAAQELFFERYGFFLSIKFEWFMKRYNASRPAPSTMASGISAALR